MNPTDGNTPTPLDNSSNQFNNFNQNFSTQKVLPNSIGILVLGICSIVFCWCYGIVSIILAIVSLVLANGAQKLYIENPDAYTLASYKNMKAGKICAIVGLCLAGLFILYLIVMVALFGTLAFNLAKMGAMH